MGFLNFGLSSRGQKKVKKRCAEKSHFRAEVEKRGKKYDLKRIWKNRGILR
jgi:hypothetical protein